MSNPEHYRPTYWRSQGASHTDEPYGSSYARPRYDEPVVASQMHGEVSPLGIAVLILIALVARHKWRKERKRAYRQATRRRYHYRD
jgi:hypothetical protein